MPSSSWRSIVCFWLAMNQSSLSAAENELWVPAKATSLSLNRHRATEPLQPPGGLAATRRRSPPLEVSATTATPMATTATAATPAVRRNWPPRCSRAPLPSAPGGWSRSSSSPVPK